MLEAEGEPLNWNPAIWYQDLWPQMRAFALAPVSDGYIRVNLAGREANGVVAPEDYDATLAELTAILERLTDPRTGRPVVERIERTRAGPHDNPDIPPDLIVCWRSDTPFDAIESPGFGRIGPLPFFRSGGHRAHGARIDNVLFARGPGIVPGSTAVPGHLHDVPATILALMGAEPAGPLDGRPLVEPGRPARAA
jgi:predicted AlkP superfamily phosphohydrolase/phosphomutase